MSQSQLEEESKKVEIQSVNIYSELPSTLSRRIKMITQTSDVIEQLARLCQIGYVELAELVVNGVMQSEYFSFTPIYAKPVRCMVRKADIDIDKYYIVMWFRVQDKEDVACIVAEQIQDTAVVRPCSASEIEEATREKPSVSGNENKKGVDILLSM